MLADLRDGAQFVSSPLARTRMTAECIAEGMGIESPDVAVDGGLQSGGSLPGRLHLDEVGVAPRHQDETVGQSAMQLAGQLDRHPAHLLDLFPQLRFKRFLP